VETLSDTLAVAQASGRFSRNVQTVLVREAQLATKETWGVSPLHIMGSLLGQVGELQLVRHSGRIALIQRL